MSEDKKTEDKKIEELEEFWDLVKKGPKKKKKIVSKGDSLTSEELLERVRKRQRELKDK